MIEWISKPWPWYISGLLITGVMTFLLIFGKNFGVSANLRTMCSIGGAGKFSEFFRFDWKAQSWNLLFVLGSVLGGYIATHYFSNPEPLALSESVIAELSELGVENAGTSYLPEKLFGLEALSSIKGWLILIGGGFLVGFGARYAGGCTSGHAISGLSNLQLPSLIAVMGFMIGGFVMTNIFLPLIF